MRLKHFVTESNPLTVYARSGIGQLAIDFHCIPSECLASPAAVSLPLPTQMSAYNPPGEVVFFQKTHKQTNPQVLILC